MVLTGAGGHFCAGGDISEMRHREILEARMRMDLPARIFKLLVNGPKPFLTAVEGRRSRLRRVICRRQRLRRGGERCALHLLLHQCRPDAGRRRNLVAAAPRGTPQGLWSYAPWPRPSMRPRRCASSSSTASANPARRWQRHCRSPSDCVLNPPITNALLKAALSTGNDSVDLAVQYRDELPVDSDEHRGLRRSCRGLQREAQARVQGQVSSCPAKISRSQVCA